MTCPLSPLPESFCGRMPSSSFHLPVYLIKLFAYYKMSRTNGIFSAPLDTSEIKKYAPLDVKKYALSCKCA